MQLIQGLDLSVLECHSFQQVDSLHPRISYVATQGTIICIVRDTNDIQRLPYPLDFLAFGIRYDYDTDYGAHNDAAGWEENCEDDWQGVPPSYCADRNILLLELDMWKPDLPVLERVFHPDAEGTRHGVVDHCKFHTLTRF
jgi:hypothetical protein